MIHKHKQRWSLSQYGQDSTNYKAALTVIRYTELYEPQIKIIREKKIYTIFLLEHITTILYQKHRIHVNKNNNDTEYEIDPKKILYIVI